MSQADIEAQRKALLELADELDMIFDRIEVSCNWRLSSDERVSVAKAAIALRQAAKEPSPVAQATWMPIETAPMDGTEIIGVFHRRYDEDGPATVYGPWTVAWDGRKWRSSWDGSEVISSESDFGTEYKGPDIDPTHWMPLPGVSIPSAQPAPAQEAQEPPIQNVGYDAATSDIRWAVNVLLEKIAGKFEKWETMDLWRSEAAATVRGFKHSGASPVPSAEGNSHD